MAFLAPYQFAPRVQRENYQPPSAFNMQIGQSDNTAQMLAMLQMLLTNKREGGSQATQDLLAHSQIESEKFSRESAQRAEDLARELRVNQQATQMESGYTTKLSNRMDKNELDYRKRTSAEFFESQRDYSFGRELKSLADKSATRVAEIKQQVIRVLQSAKERVPRDLASAGSDVVRMAEVTQFVKSLDDLAGSNAGRDPEIQAYISATRQSLEGVLTPYVTDASQLNSFMDMGVREARAKLATGMQEAGSGLRQDVYSLESESALSSGDKTRGILHLPEKHYGSVQVPDIQHAALTLQPGAVRDVQVDIPAGSFAPAQIGRTLREGVKSVMDSFRDIYTTGEEPPSFSTSMVDLFSQFYNPFPGSSQTGAQGGPGLSHPANMIPDPVFQQDVPTSGYGSSMHSLSPEDYSRLEEALGLSPAG